MGERKHTIISPIKSGSFQFNSCGTGGRSGGGISGGGKSGCCGALSVHVGDMTANFPSAADARSRALPTRGVV